MIPCRGRFDGFHVSTVAVDAACAEALQAGLANADVIVNVLARRQSQAVPGAMRTPERRALACAPRADCARYDGLRGYAPSAGSGHGRGIAPRASAMRSSR